MRAYVWHDLSPVDGCTVVRFTAEAGSIAELARLVGLVPGLQNRTAKKLLDQGSARKASPEESEVAMSQPGCLLWEDDHGAWHVTDWKGCPTD